MKRIIAAISAGVLIAGGATAIASADVLPSCAVYNSTATVPVSGNCQPYYYNGQLVFDAIYIN